MKCQNCGAEVSGRYCEFCGTRITREMLKEQEQFNKSGCAQCGSSNISFHRENQGEVRGKNYKNVVHRTVGVCKDCGYTWYTDSPMPLQPKKRKTWLWVLGWICIFPVPLTILMLRKKQLNPIVKYGVIATAWLLYLIIGMSGNADSNSTTTSHESSAPTANSVQVETSTETSEVDISQTKPEQSAIEYDDLQKAFIAFTTDITEEELLGLIEQYGFCYTVHDYNGTTNIKPRKYKLAYTDGVALQKYADSGDYIEIDFAQGDGSFLFAEYFNSSAFENAILYNYGVYWDFSEKEPNNNYTGYYSHKPGSTKGGLAITYSNGNTKETGYQPAENAEEAIAQVLK